MDKHFISGINGIIRPIDLLEDKKDYWLITQIGGDSLGKQFQIKGIFEKGERIYEIVHSDVYKSLDYYGIRNILKPLLSALDIMSSCGVVHYDIKSENILIDVQNN